MILRRDVYRGDRYKRYRDLVVEATYRAGSRYVPAAYAGRILLFLAGNLQVEADSDTRLVWCDLAREGCVVVRTSAADVWRTPEETSRKSSRRKPGRAAAGVAERAWRFGRLWIDLMTNPAAADLQANLLVLRFDFPGLRIGIAEYPEGPTGVTVFQFPDRAFGGVDTRGGAPGSSLTQAPDASFGRVSSAQSCSVVVRLMVWRLHRE